MMPDGEDPAELAALVDKANDYIDNSPAEQALQIVRIRLSLFSLA